MLHILIFSIGLFPLTSKNYCSTRYRHGLKKAVCNQRITVWTASELSKASSSKDVSISSYLLKKEVFYLNIKILFFACSLQSLVKKCWFIHPILDKFQLFWCATNLFCCVAVNSRAAALHLKMILISDKVGHSIFFSDDLWFEKRVAATLKKKGFSQVFSASAMTELN